MNKTVLVYEDYDENIHVYEDTEENVLTIIRNTLQEMDWSHTVDEDEFLEYVTDFNSMDRVLFDFNDQIVSLLRCKVEEIEGTVLK